MNRGIVGTNGGRGGRRSQWDRMYEQTEERSPRRKKHTIKCCDFVVNNNIFVWLKRKSCFWDKSQTLASIDNPEQGKCSDLRSNSTVYFRNRRNNRI